MMIGTLAILVTNSTGWYGPATVTFNAPISGNPYSPAENDARVTFSKPGKKLERMAFFSKGKWHAILSAPEKGEYAAELTVNGTPIEKQKIKLEKPGNPDFVRLDGTRFKLQTGGPYIPLGHNFGWEAGGHSYPSQLADMAKAGLNWSRIWACSWDGKNPYIPRESTTKIAIGTMWEPALDRWDEITRATEKYGIKYQFVLFHHGMYSSTTDSNWKEHPWNKANGGFLARPNDFFTDPKAKELSKNWLRYAVARYSHSTSIMAWELFNEVQWVDETKVPGGWAVIASWHREMTRYLRSIDPYHHMVTTSSEVDPAVYEPVDFEQPHTYPPSVFGAIVGTVPPKDKPLFFGEFGGTNFSGPIKPEEEQLVVRDGFWGGLLGLHSGPGQYWFWDRAYTAKLYDEYARLSKWLAQTGFAEHREAVRTAIEVTGPAKTDLVVRPGRGWSKTDKLTFNLPEDAGSGALPELSGYIQGAKGANRSMMPGSVKFRFDASQPGTAVIKVGEIARQGAAIAVTLNGNPAYAKEWVPGERNRRVDEEIKVAYPAGPVEIAIDNTAADWFTLDRVSIPGIAPGVAATAIGTSRYALARLVWNSPSGATDELKIAGLADGNYELRQLDHASGKVKSGRVRVTEGKITPYQSVGKDEGLALFKK
jgi:hypothetical protein